MEIISLVYKTSMCKKNSFQHERLCAKPCFETDVKATRNWPIAMDFGCLVLPIEKKKFLPAKCERQRYLKLTKIIAA